MKNAEISLQEGERLKALGYYQILDTCREAAYDEITRMASLICETPMAMISFIDCDRQWLKSTLGLELTEISRDFSICAHTILSNELLLVENAKKDDRFVDSPFVIHAPHIRFYAGVPLITPEGFCIGTLCVLDREPRRLSDSQKAAVEFLGRQIMSLLETRRAESVLQNTVNHLERSNTIKDQLLSLISHEIKTPFTSVLGLADLLNEESSIETNSELHEMIADLQRSSHEIYDFLELLLLWSRMEKNVLTTHRQAFTISEMTSSTLARLAVDCRRQNVTLDIEHHQSGVVVADRTMVKYMMEVMYHLGCSRLSAGEVLSICIQPNATELEFRVHMPKELIPDENIDNLLEFEFLLEHQESHGISNGLLLEMILCRRLAEANQGSFNLSMSPELGTVCTLALPLAEVLNEQPTQNGRETIFYAPKRLTS